MIYLAPLINIFGKEKTTNIIVGDFNVDLLKIAEREKYANVFDMFCSNSFLPKITFPYGTCRRILPVTLRVICSVLDT